MTSADLRRLGRQYARARQRSAALYAELVASILAATEAGATRRAIAEATGLSFQRVQQIVEKAQDINLEADS